MSAPEWILFAFKAALTLLEARRWMKHFSNEWSDHESD